MGELAGAGRLGAWTSSTTVGACFGSGEVGEEIEDVLEAAEDRVVDRELAVKDLLEVGADITEAQVESLEGLELVGYTSRQSTDGDISDIS